MAQFLAAIKGRRGKATRLGDKKSGITGRVNGWNGGVTVYATHVEGKGDQFEIFATGGSNKGGQSDFIGLVDESGKFTVAESIRKQIEEAAVRAYIQS